MRLNEKELLLAYFINHESHIENELIELRNRIRFRRITVEDNVEMMLAIQRLEDFWEFRDTCMHLLHLLGE